MQYRTLGRTGVQVSSLVPGAMNFGAIGRSTQDEATAIAGASLDGGINLIGTAGITATPLTAAALGDSHDAHHRAQFRDRYRAAAGQLR